MNVQKINVKVFTDAPDPVVLDPFLDIFARWREDRGHPAGWVDLADYAHVPNGPGIMLIGHQGNLSVDLGSPGPGLLYANKADLDGDPAERILEVFRRSLALVASLAGEKEYPRELAPRPGFWEIVFNDRLLLPNTGATDLGLQPAVREAADRIFGSGRYTLVREKDPGRRYGFTLHSDAAGSLDRIADAAQAAPSCG